LASSKTSTCLVESHRIRLGEKPGPRKLTDIEGSPPPSSRAVHPNEQKVGQKCPQACVDKQGAPGKTQTQKKHTEGESKDTDREEHRDVIRACRDDVRKAKAQLGLNLARDVKRQQEGLL